MCLEGRDLGQPSGLPLRIRRRDGLQHLALSALYGYSRVGERLLARAPKNWGKNVTLLSSMSLEGMGPSVAVEGATTRAVFEAYVEQALAPSLREGQIVVMDNLSAHKGVRVKELVEGRGCELVYLPPYSPELNPIEGHSARSRHSCVGPRRAPERRS